MKWYKVDKPYVVNAPKVGAKKIKKHFCLFPKKFRNNGVTAYMWLETVYIVYERKKGYAYCLPWCEWDYHPDYWEQIGVADSYDNALDQIWIGD